jgi:hypothetical protein
VTSLSAVSRRIAGPLLDGSMLCRAFALLSCMAGASFPVLAQSHRDTIIINSGAPRNRGVGTLVEEVRVGQLDGPEEYLLGSVGAIAIGREGQMYVYDRSVPTIRQYSAQGTYIRSIGRRGRGPGEFESVAGIAVTSDRLLVWDAGTARINVYSLAGRVLDTWALSATSSTSSSTSVSGRNLITVDDAGAAYLRTFNFAAIDQPEIVWVRVADGGRRIDTLRAPRIPYTPPSSIVRAIDGRSRLSVVLPFAPAVFIAMSPAGHFVTAVSNRYAFEIVRNGSPIVSVRRAVNPTSVTSSERSAARSSLISQARAIDPGWSWNLPEIPSTKPTFVGLHVATDGRIWIAQQPRDSERAVAVAVPRSGGGTGRRPSGSAFSCPRTAEQLYEVFETDGAFFGQVLIPANVEVFAQIGRNVWTATCVDDAPVVKRFRIEWPRGS